MHGQPQEWSHQGTYRLLGQSSTPSSWREQTLSLIHELLLNQIWCGGGEGPLRNHLQNRRSFNHRKSTSNHRLSTLLIDLCEVRCRNPATILMILQTCAASPCSQLKTLPAAPHLNSKWIITQVNHVQRDSAWLYFYLIKQTQTWHRLPRALWSHFTPTTPSQIFTPQFVCCFASFIVSSLVQDIWRESMVLYVFPCLLNVLMVYSFKMKTILLLWAHSRAFIFNPLWDSELGKSGALELFKEHDLIISIKMQT